MSNPSIQAETKFEELVFIDPFADHLETSNYMTAQDCELLFETVQSMYVEDKVKFDDAADKFLQRAKNLETDAKHSGLIEQASWIEARMHFMCGEDHALNQAREKTGLFNDHIHSEGDNHDDEKDKDKKKKKSAGGKAREKVSRASESLWSIIFNNMSKDSNKKGATIWKF